MDAPVPLGFLAFEAGGEDFAVPEDRVRRIVFYCELSRPPMAPPFLDGMMNLGGTAVPVIALARLLGLPQSAPDLYAQIIIVEGADGLVGLQVQRANRIVRGAPVVAHEAAQSFNGCVEGEIAWGDRRAGVVSIERLLLAGESRAAAHFCAIEQRRIDALGSPELTS
jgi:purine-binding chemotaxis protein CheW